MTQPGQSLLAEVFLLQAVGQTGPRSSFVRCWLTSVNLSFPFSKAGACACELSCFSRVQLCVAPCTVARKAPLSTGFSGQEYRSVLPFPSQQIFPYQDRTHLHHWQADSLLMSHQGSPKQE